MKKIIIGFMFLSLVFVSAPKARAVTIDDLANQISSLMGQIAELKAELSAAVALSRTTTTTTRTVEPTTTTETRTVAPTTTTTVAPVTTTIIAPVTTETRTVAPTTATTTPTSTERKVCKGGGVSLGWVPCGSATCASMSGRGGVCKVTNDREIIVDNNFGTQRVYFGMRNNTEVKRIQKILLDMGYLDNASQVSGNYLGRTKSAIMQFQRDNGLKVDGVYGEITSGKLFIKTNSLTNPKPAETIYCSSDGFKTYTIMAEASCSKAYQSGNCNGWCAHS